LRILHVVPTYFPATRYGGPIVAVHGLARALAARGHEVHVFTTNVDGAGTSDVPLDCPVSLEGVRVHYFASQFRRLYYSPSMLRQLRLFVPLCDILHLHSVFLWPTSAAARVAARGGIPYVVSPRGMLVRELIGRKSRIVKSAWLRLVEERTLRQASLVHFTAQRELDDARHLKVPIPAAAVIPNGVELLPPAVTEPRGDELLFLGRLNWKKGLDRLIEAMKLLPEARLVVAGNDEESYAATLPRADNVRFVGAVFGAEKDALLRRAAALVLPSISENFGNVVLEALAAGTPVVVTPEVGLAADVEAAGAGIVTPSDPPRLAAALRELLRDPARREEMGRRGRALVEERFTWPRVAEEMEAAYRGVIGG
jgi:glycosyltransferase involved in cell wall biosynthesis